MFDRIKLYEGGPVTGLLTLKIDGVRAHNGIYGWHSRGGKPLYNLPEDASYGIYEVYKDNWETSMSMCRTRNGIPISPEHLYILSPVVDSRLVIRELVNEPVPDLIEGTEGYVVHCKKELIKVKRSATLDVEVTGYKYGRGKYQGMLGALLTPLGRVGIGFSDDQRKLFTPEFITGKIIEVECMEMTAYGQFRHPRFIRLREDKK